MVGFGIDSAIEVFAAAAVTRQLRGGAHARQRPALRAIAVTFYALAAYVAFESIRELITQDKAGESLIGIALNVVALIVMIPVALIQMGTARALNNPVLVAQSTETWMSKALSISVLAGLGLNAAFGWWWADPTVALVVAGLAVHSGREAWREAGEPSQHSRPRCQAQTMSESDGGQHCTASIRRRKHRGADTQPIATGPG